MQSSADIGTYFAMQSKQFNLRATLEQAVAQHRAGDFASAGRLYRMVLQARPDQPDANHNLGTLACQAGQDEAALPYFDAAVRADPKSIVYVLSLAQTLLQCARAEDAIIALDAAQARGLDSAQLQELLTAARRDVLHLAEWDGIAAEAECRKLLALSRTGRHAELEPLLASLLERHPEAAIAWNLYSVCLARLGKEARFAFERAAALLPDDLGAQRNLARYLANLGAWPEALQTALHLCALSPGNALDRALAGNAAHALGKLADAATHYAKSLELDPRQFAIHNNLGNVQKDAGQLEQAAASFRRAAEIEPACAEAWCNLSVVAKSMGRYADAEENCRRALACNPKLVSALIQAGDLAIDGGRFAEAETLFRQARDLDPRAAEAWAGISRTRKMTRDDEPWAQGAAALAGSGLVPSQELYLRYALGKYFDDTRQFDAAFPQFERANTLNRQESLRLGRPGYDEARHRQYVDRLIAHFQPGIVTQPRFAHPSDRPVLVLGMPRSGTSLAEQILASHPDVHGAGELAHWFGAATRYGADLDAGKEAGPLLPEIATKVLRHLHAIAPQAKRIVDKMPMNFFHVGLIHAVFPNARIIHMQRNPIDVCLSIYFNSFGETQNHTGDLAHLAHYYREYERLMAHWRAVLPQGAMLEVPYEALVQDQETWTRRLIDFIGLPWDERCLQFHETARAVRTPSNWQVRQKISTSSVERWRNYEKFIGPLAGLLPPMA